MKVKDLIDQLKWYNPELNVQVIVFHNTGDKTIHVPVAEVGATKGIVYLTNQCGVL